MCSLSDLNGLFQNELKHLYSVAEIKQFIYLVLMDKYAWTRQDIAQNWDKKLTDETNIEQDLLINFLPQLAQGKPIQYCIGQTYFFDLPFFVNPNVLIPRPETEELVQKIIQNHQHKPPKTIVDIGTGSGCIAISLKKNLPLCGVYAVDISVEALILAQKNAQLNHTNIHFLNFNILDSNQWECILPLANQKFEVIVSNPPYVTQAEKTTMHANVLDFEPHLALFVGADNPLIFYEQICQFSGCYLAQKGSIYFEINQNYGSEVKDLLQSYGFEDIAICQDLNGNDRMVSATKS